MKRKVKVIIISIAVLIVIVLIGGMYVANKAFDILFSYQVKDLQIDPGILAAVENAVQPEKTPAKAPEAMNSTQAPQSSAPDSSKKAAGNTASSQSPSKSKKNTPAPTTAPKPSENTTKGSSQVSESTQVPENTQAPAPSKPVDTPKITTISPDKLKEIESQVTVADKTRALQIVMSKLSPGDIAMLESMAKGNVAAANLANARKLLSSKLSKEDKDELKALIYKYLAMAQQP